MKKEYESPAIEIREIIICEDILTNSDPEVVATSGWDNWEDSDPFDF